MNSAARQESVPLSKNPAHQAYLRGDYKKATILQLNLVNDLVNSGESPITERKLLGLYLYSAGDYGSAIEILKLVEPLAPNDAEIPENIGIMMRQSGNLQAAVSYLLKAHKMAPTKPNICDGLAHCYGNLGEESHCQHFGRLSLRLKDAEAAISSHVFEIPDETPSAIRLDHPEENVISFSLWGNNPRYIRGAIRNARLAPDLYPGWTCRFYIDKSVPRATVAELKSLGASIIEMPEPDPFFEGLLWRFQVIGDPSVKRYLVRDCDSVINIKERVAVDEWLASDKWFHMMRDFISHTEMVLAGMFGGCNAESGPLPAVSTLREGFKTNTAPTRTFDQHFLREMVWPTMRQSVLIHDSVYTGELGSIPFPNVGQLGPKKHVGQNEAATAEFAEQAEDIEFEPEGHQPFFVFGLLQSGSTYLQTLIDSHPHAACPPKHHLTTIRETLDQQVSRYERLIEDLDNKSAGQGIRFESDRLNKMLLRTWISALMKAGMTEGSTHIGLCDNHLAEELPDYLEMFPEAKFLFVVRDPRDVAVLIWEYRLRTEPRFAMSGVKLSDIVTATAEKWVQYVEEVSRIARSKRTNIEMVRYEDIVSSKRREATARNVFNFLGLDSSVATLEEIFSKTDENEFFTEMKHVSWRDELTPKQISRIEKIAGDRMRLLRYELSDEAETLEMPSVAQRSVAARSQNEVEDSNEIALSS